MLGKDIAANLRGSKRPWTKQRLCSIDEVATKNPKKFKKIYSYCVLGLKAREAGVSSEFLIYVNPDNLLYRPRGWSTQKQERLHEVFAINDRFHMKERVIDAFDANGDLDFPIEDFVIHLKTLERKWRSDKKKRASQSKEVK